MITITRTALTGIAIAAIAAGSAGVAGAQMPGGTAAKANISISKAMVRMVPPGTANTAGYMTIRSKRTADTLLRASVPPSFAMMTELHRSMMDPATGQMTMVKQKNISIPRNGVRQLRMGGYHLMLMMLKKNLAPGVRVPITLTFRKAGTVRVSAPIAEM